MNTRVGRDGRRRPVRGSEGRRRAARFITARPTASLREITREAGVSLGTARDVRECMREGINPVLPEPQAAGTSPAPASLRALPSPARPAFGDPRPCGWPAILAKLSKDPGLRYTNQGRELLRWIERHMIKPDEWSRTLDIVPSRWASEIAQAAREYSDEWRNFAQKVEDCASHAIGETGPRREESLISAQRSGESAPQLNTTAGGYGKRHVFQADQT